MMSCAIDLPTWQGDSCGSCTRSSLLGVGDLFGQTFGMQRSPRGVTVSMKRKTRPNQPIHLQHVEQVSRMTNNCGLPQSGSFVVSLLLLMLI